MSSPSALTTVIRPGYKRIPGGEVVSGPHAGEYAGMKVDSFNRTIHPWTNGKYRAEFYSGLGQDVFIAMGYDKRTGATYIMRQGCDADSVLGKDLAPVLKTKYTNFDSGEILPLMDGALYVFRFLPDPSARYNRTTKSGKDLVFNRLMQPLVGISRLEAKAMLEIRGERLPTDLEEFYVESNGGRYEFGTKDGKLYGANGQKQAHVDEWKEDRERAPVDVNDKRYPQPEEGPFGVQACGNVFVMTEHNSGQDFPNGVRGGAFGLNEGYGRALIRDSHDLVSRYIIVGLVSVG